MQKDRPFFGILFAFLIFCTCVSPQFRSVYQMPETVVLRQEGGEFAELPYPLVCEIEAVSVPAMQKNGARVQPSANMRV